MDSTAAFLPEVTSYQGGDDQGQLLSDWSSGQIQPHPEAEEIVRQVDFYFSEENLPSDTHLLGKLKEGNGSVSINHLRSFTKMRRFKPMTAVREAIRQSTVVEICENNKRVRRRKPLQTAIKVVPSISPDQQKRKVPAEKPWLTKNMMKPTGFEPYVADGPIRPDEFNKDREAYDPELSFVERIETAILRFCNRRTMHQETRNIFEKFTMFGGMTHAHRQFTGGVGEKSKEGYTKKEIAEMTSNYKVSDQVVAGFHEDNQEDSTWEVDFEAVVRAFLGSQFRTLFGSSDEGVMTVTNVIRNFYNYLLLHDVCPEYKEDLFAARKVCDVAEQEFLMLTKADANLPGDFNVACSTLFGGSFAGLHGNIGSSWVVPEANMGMTKTEAALVFKTGAFAYGTELQMSTVEQIMEGSAPESLKVVSSESTGLEVVKIIHIEGEAKDVYEDVRLAGTSIRPMGKLRCVRWDPPQAPPMDLPAAVTQAKKTDEFEFLVGEETLQHCFLGLRMEATVKELDVGIKWIDLFEASYPSFFVWLENERIRGWKEPGPPTRWMQSQMAKKGHSQEDPQDGWGEASKEMVEDGDEHDTDGSGGTAGYDGSDEPA